MLRSNVTQQVAPLGSNLKKFGQQKRDTRGARPAQCSQSQSSWMPSPLASIRKRKHLGDKNVGDGTGSYKRRQSKCLDSLQHVPTSQRLKMLKVSRKTYDLYLKAVEQFEVWAKSQRRSLVSHRSADETMSMYLFDLCEKGEPMSHGTYALFGWIKLRSQVHLDSRQQMPFSREALKGWRSHFPGHSRTGVDLVLWDLVALHAIHKGYMLCAAGILIQGDGYLRPCELFDLTPQHLIKPPGSRLTGIWGAVIGLLESGKPTKAGEYDDVVLFDSKGRTDVNEVVRRLFRRSLSSETSILSPLTYEQYGRQLAEAAKSAGLGHLHLTPHCLRHSGASHDAYHKIRGICEIQSRGRWKAAKSVARYKRPGRMLLSQSQVSAAIWKKAVRARSQVLQLLVF